MFYKFEFAFIFLIGFANIAEAMRESCSGKTFATIKNKEFRLFNNIVNHEDAKQKCQTWGRNWLSGNTGKLVTIKSLEEQLCINEIVSSSSNRMLVLRLPLSSRSEVPGYFIGATYRKADSTWILQNGENVRTTKWNEKLLRDNAGNGKSCSQLVVKSQTINGERYSTGEWLKTSCSGQNFYICEREINPSLNWGYENNRHAETPNQWSKLYPTCEGRRQSPINLHVSSIARCDYRREGLIVRNYRSAPNSRWIVKNTGRFIKIEPSPARSTWTTFLGSRKRYYVDHMILKWGSNRTVGSEHLVGGIQYAGEIFHHPIDGNPSNDIHAISYLIEQRTFQANANWNDIINSLRYIQHANERVQVQAPRIGVERLLEDSINEGSSTVAQTVNFIHEIAFRYRGSLPHPPCTQNVVWTVFPRPIQLSFSQFSTLRRLRMEGGESILVNNFRTVQDNDWPVCSLEKF